LFQLELREKVRSLIKDNKVKAIIFDDIQNLNQVKRLAFFQIMKWLSETTSLKFILSGITISQIPLIIIRRSKIIYEFEVSESEDVL
jgi:hypothetical protein